MSHDQTLLHNGRILVDGVFRDDLVVILRGQHIESVERASSVSVRNGIDLEGQYLAPGFIDIQVNGGGGVLFNDSPTVEGIQAIAAAHRPFGTTGLLPTLISDDLEVVEQGLKAVDDAITQGVPGVLGIHIEGPFLDLERRGIHPAARIREMTREWLDRAQPLRHGKTLITVAPEHIEPGWITELNRKGFIVSAGHSNATAEQVRQAEAEGLRGFTHLYNAMSPLNSRAPGVVGAALASPDTWCGIIADGHHVAPVSLEVARRCKGAERLILITDAMPPVGSPEPSFDLLGTVIHVVDGVCVDDNGTLAGAALDMASAVRNMTAMTAASLAESCAMASATPAAFLGLQNELGAIAAGQRADLVVFNEKLEINATLVGGEPGDKVA